MQVLVTGATGFLGSHVVRELRSRGHAVRALVRPGRPREHVESTGVELAEGDLLDRASLFGACRGVDGLVHCAARMGFWSRQDLEQRMVIVEGSSALFRAAHKAKVQRIAHVSSIAAVGASREPVRMDEGWRWNGIRLGANYVRCKREIEDRVWCAVRGGMPITVVNPVFLVGPRLDGRGRSALVERVAGGKVRWVPPGGAALCDVEDAARGAVTALEEGRFGERYILGGHDLTWRELHEAVARELGVTSRARTAPLAVGRALALGAGALDLVRLSRPRFAPELYRAWGWYAFADSTKAERELGYRARPLDETIARMCEAA